jgi:RimJ/RimL family protein N-acetyltransferase
MDMTVLKTGNVVLRPTQRADIARQCEYFCDEELAWLDSSNPEAYRGLDVEKLLQPDSVDGQGTVTFAIEVDGEYVGYCSLMHTTNPDGIFELGINIGDRRYWSLGLGRQAIGLLLQLGFESIGATEIQLTTNAKNHRALRCFAAVGFRETDRIPGAIQYREEMVDMIEMAIIDEDWRRIVEDARVS